MKKSIIALLSCLLVMAMLVGCGAQSAPQAEAPATNGGTAASADPAAPAAPVKDSVTIATIQEPLHFYPFGPSDSNTRDCPVLCNVYDPLVQLEADGSLSPALAEKWEISEDGTEYTFYLRQGVKFHNGDDFNAEDVKFTYDTAAFESTAGKALLINYDHSEIVDDYTIKVYLTAPFAAFMNGCASRVGGICSKEYFEEVGVDGYLAAPIGTGAYKFVSAVNGDTITLEANNDHWAGAPAIKNVYIKTMSDASTMIISLENGDVDVLANPALNSCLNLDTSGDVTWEAGAGAGRITLHITANGIGYPGDDINFRKAVQCAIDKQAVVDGATDGYATIIDIDMCPAYSGRPDGYNTVPYNVEKAKEYLAASSYNGEEFDILCESGTLANSVAEIVQYQLSEVGINCTINAVDNATFTETWYAGTYGAQIRTSNSSLVDADGFLNYYMLPPYVNTDNNQYERNPEIYALGMDGRAAQGDARKDIYLKAVNIVTEEAYSVPLFSSVNVMAYNKGLQGVKVHPLNNMYFRAWTW